VRPGNWPAIAAVAAAVGVSGVLSASFALAFALAFAFGFAFAGLARSSCNIPSTSALSVQLFEPTQLCSLHGVWI